MKLSLVTFAALAGATSAFVPAPQANVVRVATPVFMAEEEAATEEAAKKIETERQAKLEAEFEAELEAEAEAERKVQEE